MFLSWGWRFLAQKENKITDVMTALQVPLFEHLGREQKIFTRVWPQE